MLLKALNKEFSAIIALQSAIRLFLAKQTRGSMLAYNTIRKEAAIVLQCYVRSSYAKRTLVCLQVQQTKRIEAAAVIQCGVRSLFARKAYHVARTEWMSNGIMHRAAQVFLAKKISLARQEESKRETEAALALQCAFRSHFARGALNRLHQEQSAKERKRLAAVTLQCATRFINARIVRRGLNQSKAVRPLQVGIRAFLARKDFASIRSLSHETAAISASPAHNKVCFYCSSPIQWLIK